MSEPKKFEFSPAISIVVAGATIAGAILLTHFFPAAQPVATNNQNNQQATLQQQMSPALYEEIAKALKVDLTKYKSCVDASKYQDKIDAETAEAQKAGGQGTPFTVVYDTKTGKSLPISGALPYAQLKTAIASINTDGTKSTIRPPSASDHIIGSPTAPIVLVEYSDFQCPYCQMIHADLKRIVSESNGSVAWVYRNFPLYQIHPQATPAANAAECIAEQLGSEGFWQFTNTVFEG
ncbi:MAG: thioredoxin domain-containing protein [Patescibacteria group bacterium]